MRDLIAKILEEESKKKLSQNKQYELDERRAPFTDDQIFDKMNSYETFGEFRKKHRTLYKRIENNEKLQKNEKFISWYNDKYDRMLYMYVWLPTNNSERKIGCVRDKIVVYFGLTCNENTRFNQHIEASLNSKWGNKSAINEYINKCGDFDIYRPATGFKKAIDAIRDEKCIIDRFKNDKDFHILNKIGGGGLGGKCGGASRSVIEDIEKIRKDLGRSLENEDELVNKFPDIHDYYSKNTQSKRAFNKGYGKNIYKVKKDLTDLLSLSKEFSNPNDFRQMYGKEIESLKEPINFDILFPSNNYYVNTKTKKKYHTLRDLYQSLTPEDTKNELGDNFLNLYFDILRRKRDNFFSPTLPVAFISNNEDYTDEDINENRNLIKKILKEETNPEINLTDQEKKGVDISVNILKKRYPFFEGWELIKKNVFELDITLICNIEKLCEFYNSDLKEYFKRAPEEMNKRDFPYQISVLKLAEEIDNDKKWNLYKDLLLHLNEIYDYIPDDLKIKDKFEDNIKLNAESFTFR